MKATTARRSRRTSLLIALLLAAGLVTVDVTPAQAIGGERVAVLFPYAGGGKTWVSGDGPGVHPVYFSGYGWSADLHAAEDTAVRARFQSSDGAITLKVLAAAELNCAPSAGSYVALEVKVDGVFVGKVIYEHLENLQVSANQEISVGATLGNLNLWSQSSCWADTLVDGVVHSHLEVQKGCYRSLSAWTNYSGSTAVGLLGSEYGNTSSSTCSESDVTQVMGASDGSGTSGSARSDFDGDHKTDLMFLHKTGDNGANMYIYNQATGYASPGLIRGYPNSALWNWNNMKVATGDVNNDGVSDLLMLHKLGDGGANFYIFYGGAYQFADAAPVKTFAASGYWSWDSMLVPTG